MADAFSNCKITAVLPVWRRPAHSHNYFSLISPQIYVCRPNTGSYNYWIYVRYHIAGLCCVRLRWRYCDFMQEYLFEARSLLSFFVDDIYLYVSKYFYNSVTLIWITWFDLLVMGFVSWCVWVLNWYPAPNFYCQRLLQTAFPSLSQTFDTSFSHFYFLQALYLCNLLFFMLFFYPFIHLFIH